jgi:phosphoribosylamine--glycine ligase
MLEGGELGAAGATVVVEDFVQGEEASFIALVGVDGAILPLATSQDHKTRDDGDRGPNTGGMGAISPAAVITPDVERRVMDTVMRPVVDGLRREGVRYYGFLYAGLMIAPDGSIQVLEFNCRCGDPETQPILYRLRSDFSRLLDAALDGQLARMRAEWDPRPAAGVVMAAEGYPGSYRTGDEIGGLPAEDLPNAKVFHAGTGRDASGRIVTRGGRVLCVVGRGDTVGDARREAYGLVERIHWPGVHYRRDIGHRAVAREPSGT